MHGCNRFLSAATGSGRFYHHHHHHHHHQQQQQLPKKRPAPSPELRAIRSVSALLLLGIVSYSYDADFFGNFEPAFWAAFWLIIALSLGAREFCRSRYVAFMHCGWMATMIAATEVAGDRSAAEDLALAEHLLLFSAGAFFFDAACGLLTKDFVFVAHGTTGCFLAYSFPRLKARLVTRWENSFTVSNCDADAARIAIATPCCCSSAPAARAAAHPAARAYRY